MAFDLKEKEADVFMSGVAGFDLQAKAKKILVFKGRGEIAVVGTGSPPEDDLSDAMVSLDGVVIELDPREEWRQIFFESWRSMRDFFWHESMAQLDWVAMRDQYAALLPRLATRGDLVDLVAELIGELTEEVRRLGPYESFQEMCASGDGRITGTEVEHGRS